MGYELGTWHLFTIVLVVKYRYTANTLFEKSWDFGPFHKYIRQRHHNADIKEGGNRAGNCDRSLARVPKQRLRGVTFTPRLQAGIKEWFQKVLHPRTLTRREGKVRTRYT